MVRIQCRVSRKRYLNSKRVYEYERVSLHIPRKHHELIKPLLNQDFGVSVAAEKGTIVITLPAILVLAFMVYWLLAAMGTHSDPIERALW